MADATNLFDNVLASNAARDPLVGRLLSDLEPIERVHYEAGILLDRNDFVDEQTYHRGRLARALAALFGHGTVAGLRVHEVLDRTQEPPVALVPNTEREVVVEPGLALDRLGRLIELRQAQCFRIARWFAWMNGNQRDALERAVIDDDGPAHLLLDFFVRFVQCEHGRTPAFAAGPFDATDATAPARDRDAVEITWRLRPLAERDRIPANAAATPQEIGLLLTQSPPDAQVQQRRALIDREILDRKLDTGTTPGAFIEQPEAGWDQVLLARVRIPLDATAAPLALADPPTLAIDNYLRPFVFAPGRWLGN